MIFLTSATEFEGSQSTSNLLPFSVLTVSFILFYYVSTSMSLVYQLFDRNRWSARLAHYCSMVDLALACFSAIRRQPSSNRRIRNSEHKSPSRPKVLYLNSYIACHMHITLRRRFDVHGASSSSTQQWRKLISVSAVSRFGPEVPPQ